MLARTPDSDGAEVRVHAHRPHWLDVNGRVVHVLRRLRVLVHVDAVHALRAVDREVEEVVAPSAVAVRGGCPVRRQRRHLPRRGVALGGRRGRRAPQRADRVDVKGPEAPPRAVRLTDVLGRRPDVAPVERRRSIERVEVRLRVDRRGHAHAARGRDRGDGSRNVGRVVRHAGARRGNVPCYEHESPVRGAREAAVGVHRILMLVRRAGQHQAAIHVAVVAGQVRQRP